MISTNFKTLIENDLTPLIIFDKHGKIVYLNKNAEMVVNVSTQKELYDLALSHAPKSFGSKVTHLNLSYKTFKFYAINVYYENEEEIVLQLYHKPLPLRKKMPLEGYVPTDINLLLEANIERFKIDFKGKITLFTDYDLPKLYLNQNRFSQLLQKIFGQCQEAQKIALSLTIKLGESIHINQKRYTILLFKIQPDKRETQEDESIERISEQNMINTILKKNEIILEIPYIHIDKEE